MAYTEQADIDILAYGDYSVNDDVENTDLNDMLDAFKALSDNIVAIIGADSTPSETVNDLAVSVAAVAPHDPSIMRTIISNNGADSDHDLDFTAGYEIDSTGTYRMGGDAMTKKMDTAWAAGDGNGGLFAGALANSTWYYVYKIRKDSDGSIDYGCDTAANGVANLPAGYSVYRRIGYFVTDDSANIRSFIQLGQYFHLVEVPQDYNATNPGTSDVDVTVFCPPNTIGIMYIELLNTGATQTKMFVKTTSTTTGASLTVRSLIAADGYEVAGAVFTIPVDGSSQIRYDLNRSDANVGVNMWCYGWIDTGI